MYIIENGRIIFLFCVRLRFITTHMVVLKRKRTQTDTNGRKRKANGRKQKTTDVKKSNGSEKIERKWKKATEAK